MESRGCTPELLAKLYYSGKTKTALKEMFGIRDSKVIDRWFKQSGIVSRDGSYYSFNKYYFDKIDTEGKAYWLGFIWRDGYVLERKRNGLTGYEFKLDLARVDENHLYKFKEELSSNHEIKRYSFKTNFIEEADISRLYISNKYFAGNLHNNYGLCAGRFDISKIKNEIPPDLVKHFIRGVLEADGSISSGYVNDNRRGKNKRCYKARIQFTTFEQLCEYVDCHFSDINLTKTRMKLTKRHKEGDEYCKGLAYCGNNQVPQILHYLYEEANIYLDRKYNKYIETINELKKVNEGSDVLELETKETLS